MKVEHEVVQTPYTSGHMVGRSRLEVVVSINGERLGSVQVMSGPTEEVEAFMKGEMTMEEVRAAWSKRRLI